jgi:hypothetical protein
LICVFLIHFKFSLQIILHPTPYIFSYKKLCNFQTEEVIGENIAYSSFFIGPTSLLLVFSKSEVKFNNNNLLYAYVFTYLSISWCNFYLRTIFFLCGISYTKDLTQSMCILFKVIKYYRISSILANELEIYKKKVMVCRFV